MTLPPTSLFGRLLLAAIAALAVLAAAAVWLTPPAVGSLRAAPPGDGEPASPSRLPAGLRPVGMVWLYGPADKPPQMLAPVLELMPSGAVMLRRPAPVPLVPHLEVGPAAVLLPGPHLAGLTPAQRAALLDVLAALIPERPVRATAVHLHGIDANAVTVGRLLAWVR
ncbi:MAG: hypothetical protein IPK26_14185 [Planctomycetes bacterium]|nr:hypothetical protein [Planctomycetota bacterium]